MGRFGDRSERGRGGRPPPHLKGKEIGLFYARKGKARKEELGKKLRPRIEMQDYVKEQLNIIVEEYCIQFGLQIDDIPVKKDVVDTDSKQIDQQQILPTSSNVGEEKIEENEDECISRSDSQNSLVNIDYSQIETKQTTTGNENGSLNTLLNEFTNEEESFIMEEICTEHATFATNDDKFPVSQMTADNKLDEKLKAEWKNTTNSDEYLRILTNRNRLPTLKMADEIMKVINENQVTVISGETGCGKSTQVPQLVLNSSLESGNPSVTNVVVTQPRRISATSLAQRVAQERCENLGESVGYQIRLEPRKPRQKGSILYCTNGILLRWLLSDKTLCAVSHLVLDEIHERDLFSDFLLIIIRDLLAIRKDLKVVLMSATLNAQHFSRYFHNAPMIEIPGRQFPVQSYFLEDVLQMTRYNKNVQSRRRMWIPEQFMHLPPDERRRAVEEYQIEYRKSVDSLANQYDVNVLHNLRNWNEDEIDNELIISLVSFISKQSDKSDQAILIFLPGWQNIKNLLKDFVRADAIFSNCSKFSFVPVHSLLPNVDQKKVFARPPAGCRKVILATNIAETSITIEDVVHVIDCGKIKMSNFDPQSNIQTLKSVFSRVLSDQNITQLTFNTGRMGVSGKCQAKERKSGQNDQWFLLSLIYEQLLRCRFDSLQLFLAPEMHRTRLESLCLQIKLMNIGRVAQFLSKAPDPPSQLSVNRAVNELVCMGAMMSDEDDSLTPLGIHLASLPADPHSAKLIIMGAVFSCLDPALTVACSLDYKDPFSVPFGKESEVDRVKRNLSSQVFCAFTFLQMDYVLDDCNLKSDHLVWIHLYKQFAETRGYETGDFCRRFFLNRTTMNLVQKMKLQMCQYLKQAGFVHEIDVLSPEANVHSNNLKMISAVIGASLFPKVCESIPKINVNSRGGLKFTCGGRWQSRVEIHPKSVNAEVNEIESRYVCYHQIIRSSKIYMNDCGMVSPLTLALNGSNLVVANELLVIDSWIQFYCSPEIAQLLHKTNVTLRHVLMNLYSRPRVLDWRNDVRGIMGVMKIVAQLIDNEQNSVDRPLQDERFEQGRQNRGNVNYYANRARRARGRYRY